MCVCMLALMLNDFDINIHVEAKCCKIPYSFEMKRTFHIMAFLLFFMYSHIFLLREKHSIFICII
jgi:hypothetical protein